MIIKIGAGFYFVIMIMLNNTVNAEIYRWTDEQGNVHFGDTPVDMDEATELDIDSETRAGITHSSGNEKERKRVTKRLVKEREAREERREKIRLAHIERNKRCKRYRSKLSSQLRSNRSYTYDKHGERIYFTREQREARERKLRKGVADNCH